jgi:hypothetical protein
MKLLNHVRIKEAESEIMVFDSQTGDLYTADNVSKEILSLLKNETSEDKIISHVQKLYPNISKAAISTDIREFIETLRKSKLVC